jgi:hypothetical protein
MFCTVIINSCLTLRRVNWKGFRKTLPINPARYNSRLTLRRVNWKGFRKTLPINPAQSYNKFFIIDSIMNEIVSENINMIKI